MSRILVTGATGFVGRHAAAALAERGHEVHAADSRRADLLDAARARALVAEVRPTHLLHFAWNVKPGYLASPENVRWVEASLALLRAFADAGGERAVMAGTCFEYDLADGVCKEDSTPLRPRSLYGTCKASLGQVVSAAADELGVSTAWGRLFFAYGPDEHPSRLVPAIARNVLAGRPAPCSHGEQLRDYMHAADIGAAFAAILDSGVGGAVNVGSGRPVRLRDLIEAVAREAGDPSLPRFGEVSVPEDDPPLIAADVGRLRDEVGFEPRVRLEDGLRETVEWWRARERPP